MAEKNKKRGSNRPAVSSEKSDKKNNNKKETGNNKVSNKKQGKAKENTAGKGKAEQVQEKKSKLPLIIIITAAVLALTILCDILARNADGFAEFYSGGIYPIFVHIIGFINGLFPFAVGEVLILLFSIAAIVGIIVMIVRLVKAENKGKTGLYSFTAVFVAVTFIYSSYTFFCGINYHRVPFSEKSGLTPTKYSVEELGTLCTYLIENANAEAEKIETGENGLMNLETDGFDMKAECVEAMGKVGEQYPALSGFYPSPKGLMISEFMSMCQITGIYNPFTIEANYNANVPDFSIPFTVCHELSHLKGFMREDEANFIAYLACRESDNEYIRYSGYVEALIYAMGQYYSAAGAEKYTELYMTIHPTILKELQSNNKYWEQYETPVAEVSSKINDTYLKNQGQEEGTKSYGRFVDLMLYDLLK